MMDMGFLRTNSRALLLVRAIWVPKSSSGGGTKPPKMAKKCKKNFVPSLLGPKRSEGGGKNKMVQTCF